MWPHLGAAPLVDDIDETGPRENLLPIVECWIIILLLLGGEARLRPPRSRAARPSRAALRRRSCPTLACESCFGGGTSGPLFSCRGQQAALKCPHYRDSTTRD